MGHCHEAPGLGAGPQDQVGHGQVGDDLPVGDELMEPVEVLGAQADDAAEGGGKLSGHVPIVSGDDPGYGG